MAKKEYSENFAPYFVRPCIIRLLIDPTIAANVSQQLSHQYQSRLVGEFRRVYLIVIRRLKRIKHHLRHSTTTYGTGGPLLSVDGKQGTHVFSASTKITVGRGIEGDIRFIGLDEEILVSRYC